MPQHSITALLAWIVALTVVCSSSPMMVTASIEGTTKDKLQPHDEMDLGLTRSGANSAGWDLIDAKLLTFNDTTSDAPREGLSDFLSTAQVWAENRDPDDEAALIVKETSAEDRSNSGNVEDEAPSLPMNTIELIDLLLALSDRDVIILNAIKDLIDTNFTEFDGTITDAPRTKADTDLLVTVQEREKKLENEGAPEMKSTNRVDLDSKPDDINQATEEDENFGTRVTLLPSTNSTVSMAPQSGEKALWLYLLCAALLLLIGIPVILVLVFLAVQLAKCWRRRSSRASTRNAFGDSDDDFPDDDAMKPDVAEFEILPLIVEEEEETEDVEPFAKPEAKLIVAA